MKNPKSEIRNPKEVRSSKSESAQAIGNRQSAIANSRTPLLIAVFLGLALPLHAQTNYTIDWFTVASGGGTSTGGVYSVSGTIGQPEAGAQMTNGHYSIDGGFWALPVAVQSSNAPTLTIAPAGAGQATISWAPNTPGFVLQESLSVSPASWSNSPSGATNPVVVPATLPTKFYRLHKP